MELLQGRDELVCLAFDYSPADINITWLLNGVTFEQKNNTSSSAKGPDGKFRIKSYLNIKASGWKPGDKFTCHVNHVTGIVTRNVSKTGDFSFYLKVGSITFRAGSIPKNSKSATAVLVCKVLSPSTCPHAFELPNTPSPLG